jgi:hypothetical protein
MNRDAINSLLVKLQVDGTIVPKLTDERARVKLLKRIESLGVPADVTPEERAEIAAIIGPQDQQQQNDQAPPAGAEDGGSTEPTATEAPPEDSGNASNAGTEPQQENDVARKDKKKAKRPASKKGESKAPKVKAPKVKAPKVKAPKVKAPKPPKKKSAGNGKRKNGGGASEYFRSVFSKNGATVLKSEVVEKLVGHGIGEGSARAFIVWAKRGKQGKPSIALNPWPFQIKETKDDKGNKVLTKAKDFPVKSSAK